MWRSTKKAAALNRSGIEAGGSPMTSPVANGGRGRKKVAEAEGVRSLRGLLASMAGSYGSQSMSDSLRTVLVRRPDASFGRADPKRWGYQAKPDLAAAQKEHDGLVELLKQSGVEVRYHEAPQPGRADSIFVHDPAIVTDGRGAHPPNGEGTPARGRGFHGTGPEDGRRPGPRKPAGRGDRRRRRSPLGEPRRPRCGPRIPHERRRIETDPRSHETDRG